MSVSHSTTRRRRALPDMMTPMVVELTNDTAPVQGTTSGRCETSLAESGSSHQSATTGGFALFSEAISVGKSYIE